MPGSRGSRPAPTRRSCSRRCAGRVSPLWRIERRHPTTGLILRDLLRGEETWLVDEAMEKNAPPGVEMAARLLQPESFAMTARIIVPLLPDLMTLPELMEEVFTRAPALRHLQGRRSCRGPALRDRLLSRRRGHRSDGSRPLPTQIGRLHADGRRSRRPSESAKVQVRVTPKTKKSLYHQSSIDFRCYLELARFEPRPPVLARVVRRFLNRGGKRRTNVLGTIAALGGTGCGRAVPWFEAGQGSRALKFGRNAGWRPSPVPC